MAQIIKRKTSDGESRYDVRTRIGGRVVTRTFRRRKDANNYATTTESDKLRGIVVDPRGARTPFADVAKAWLAANTTKRPSSLARDQAIITHHLNPAFGKRPIGSINKADVQALVHAWTADKAASTVGRQYSCLRAIFAYAESDERIVRSPCRDIRLPRVALVDRPSLSAGQLTALADALGPDLAPMMWCGAVLGLRWAEVAGLTVDRLDILGGRLTVDRQLARSRELAPPKSHAGRRILACPAWLVDELAALLARRRLTAANADAFLFVTGAGTPLDYTRWRSRTWVPACNKAGLPGVRFHDLRSLAATALVAAGVDVKTAQTRLGHSSPQVTLAIYARATVDADRAAAELVGAVLRPRDGRAMESA